jgi:MFS family permease
MAEASLTKGKASAAGWSQYLHYSRNVYLLLLFTLGKGFQLSIGALSINLYVKSLGYDLQFVGLFAAMAPLGALVAGVPVGFLADRVGRKPLLLLSGFLTPLTLLFMAFSGNGPLLMFASFLNGVTASAYWVTNLPMLTESTNEDQRVGALALNSFLLLGVGALGALIGGAVPELVSSITHLPADTTVPLRWGVIAAAIIVFLPALPLVFVKEPPRPTRAAAKAEQVASMPGANDPAAGDIEGAVPETAVTQGRLAARWGVVGLFAALLIPDLLFTTGEGSVIALLQIFFKYRFLLPLGALGVLFTVAGLFGGATSLTAPRFVKRWGKLRMATTLQYLGAPVMLLIGFSPIFALAAVAEFTRQILRGLFEPVYATFAMERVSTRHRATLSGFYSLTWSMGFSIGPVVAGWLQDHVSLSAAFPIGAGCLALSATLLRIFFREEYQAEGKAHARPA